MARLLVDGRWFDPVQADSIYESDLEDLIIAQSASLYPNFWVIKYKRMIQSEYGTGSGLYREELPNLVSVRGGTRHP